MTPAELQFIGGTRIGLMTYLMEALLMEKVGGQPPTNSILVLAFKKAATGDRDAFNAFVDEHIPEEGRAWVRGRCEEIVFTEIARRELLATNPSKSKTPFPWVAWHVEIRIVLELLLGPPEGVQPTWVPRT